MIKSSFKGFMVTVLIVATLSCSMNSYARNTFLEKDTRPIAFSNKEVTLYDSWIKQRETLNTNYLHQLDPEQLLHNLG